MYVLALHDIHDRAAWEMVKDFAPPEGFTLHFTIAADDGRRAVCLWEAQSVDTVQQLLDEGFGAVAKNEAYEVSEEYVAAAKLPSGLPR